MGIAQDIAEDWQAALAALAWQVDLGVGEASGDAPVNRYELPAAAKPEATPAPVVMEAVPRSDMAAMAAEHAARAHDLVALKAAMDAFPFGDMRRGARTMVFGEGQPGARVLVLAPPPGREEDQAGRVFAGEAGVLFARMFAAIGLAQDAGDPAASVYLLPAMPWRPPSDRAPAAEEMAMMRPFLDRHIALVAPKVVVAMGISACEVLLGSPGLSRIRGTWAEAMGCPVLPMFDPRHLMRNREAKREAWADLLMVQARLRGME